MAHEMRFNQNVNPGWHGVARPWYPSENLSVHPVDDIDSLVTVADFREDVGFYNENAATDFQECMDEGRCVVCGTDTDVTEYDYFDSTEFGYNVQRVFMCRPCKDYAVKDGEDIQPVA